MTDSNQSILKEINPEYSVEGLLLKLKLQYFGYLMQRADSLEKILMLGKFEGKKRREWQRMRWWDGVTDSTDISLSKLREIAKEQGRLACCSSWIAKRHDLATEQQQRLIHIVVQLKPTQYCKVIILQLKKKKVQAHSRFPQRFS